MLSKIFSIEGNPAPHLMQRLTGQGGGIDATEAALLRGDVVLQQALISVLPFAQSHTAGALCFASLETGKVDGCAREELMDSFEGMVNGGLDRTRLSWLWMEDQVRSQTRLVWVVANVDLITKKRFVPYFDRVDRPLFAAWQKYENLSRSLQDPQGAGNRKMVSYNPRLPDKKKKWAAGLARYLSEKCASGELKNREDITQFLKVEMFQEVSFGSDFITVYLPEMEERYGLPGTERYRLTGPIFREDYTYTPNPSPQDPADIAALRVHLESLQSDREQLFAQRFRLPQPRRSKVNEKEELLCDAPDLNSSESAKEPVAPAEPTQSDYARYAYSKYSQGNRNSWRWR